VTPDLTSGPPFLQTAVIGCAALVASLISISICLWPRTDEPQIAELQASRSKENCHEHPAQN
jgi:hypothetical protein